MSREKFHKTLNLCFPDGSKSCVACCGLYNLADASRQTLQSLLETRTIEFRATERTIEALVTYEQNVREREKPEPQDPVIHVCEFVGFLDEAMRSPGCMLHPSAPGNGGTDFRGLCHYGSLACRSFYCPSWDHLNGAVGGMLVDVVDDWYVYGLVITDPEYVNALIALAGQRIGGTPDLERFLAGPCRDVFREMLYWKETWPLRGSSRLRRNRYYVQPCNRRRPGEQQDLTGSLIGILDHTFGVRSPEQQARDVIAAAVERFFQVFSR